MARALKTGGRLVLDDLNVCHAEAQPRPDEVIARDGVVYRISRWSDARHFFKRIVIEDRCALTGPRDAFVLRIAAFAAGDATAQTPSDSAAAIARNKATARRWSEERWSRGNLAVADEIVAADYIRHDPGDPFPARGPEDVKRIVTVLRSMLPDFRITVEAVVAEGDPHGRNSDLSLRGRQDRGKLGGPRRSRDTAATGAVSSCSSEIRIGASLSV